MVKALIFDVGGVLVDLDMQASIDAYRDILGYDITSMLDPSHQKGMYKLLEEGAVTADEFRDYILQGSRPGSEPGMVDRCMGALLVGTNPETAALVNELSESFDLYILSNNNPISMPLCRDVMARAGIDCDKVFKRQFVSSEMKVLKPSAEMFQRVIEAIGLPPSELLFIDDSLANVEAAARHGIGVLHYVQGTSLRDALSGVI